MVDNQQPLTSRQEEIYQWMWKFWKANGYAPSQEEVAESQGISLSTTQKHIKALDKKGRIKSIPGKCRAITFPE